MDYGTLKALHQGAVALSVSGFALRGLLMLRDSPRARSRLARTLPHAIDTVLLATAVALAWRLGAGPHDTPWIAAKVGGLVAYVALGTLALRPGRPKPVRAAAWLAALATVGWIASVAIAKDPWGGLAAIVR